MNTIHDETKQRALVVEDDLWMQPLLHSAIRSALPGAQIDWVESAEEATNMIQYHHYSVIVADINLKPNKKPGIDFWNICREKCPETPVLLTSSTSVDSFFQKMGFYGPHYLSKPFSITQCKNIIHNVVSNHGLSS